MISYNITNGLEAVTYRWQKSYPQRMVGLTTGEVETFSYTGPIDHLKNQLAPQLLAEGSESLQVMVSLTRLAGGMGELTVTKTSYISQEPEDPENPETPVNPVAGQVGTSSSTPAVQIDISGNMANILTHPLIQAAGLDPDSSSFIGLKMLAEGADMNATFSVTRSGQVIVFTVGEAVSDVSSDIVALVTTQSSFYEPLVQMTIKYQVPDSAEIPDPGTFCKIATPENNPSVGADRNWLLLGGGLTIEGGQAWMVKKYLLSQPGGWNPTAYS